MTRMGPDEDDRVCSIEGCDMGAIYHLVKLAQKKPEREKFFCQDHGMEFATRGHIVISENV